MPRQTSKDADKLISFHDSKRMEVEKSISSKGFFESSFDISLLKGIEETIDAVLNFQGCHHGKIVVDNSGEPTNEEEPSWRIKFNRSVK